MNRYGFSFVSALFLLFLFAAMSFPVVTCFAQTETAVHTAPASYEPGGTVTVTNTFTYSGTLLTLLWRPDLPQGWQVESVGGDGESGVQRTVRGGHLDRELALEPGGDDLHRPCSRRRDGIGADYRRG